MLTLDKARQLALHGVAEVTGRRDLAIVDDQTECKRSGWYFRYESRAYVETRDVSRAIGSTGPVVVTHRGVVHVLGGGAPTHEVLAAFERHLAECTTHR